MPLLHTYIHIPYIVQSYLAIDFFSDFIFIYLLIEDYSSNSFEREVHGRFTGNLTLVQFLVLTLRIEIK